MPYLAAFSVCTIHCAGHRTKGHAMEMRMQWGLASPAKREEVCRHHRAVFRKIDFEVHIANIYKHESITILSSRHTSEENMRLYDTINILEHFHLITPLISGLPQELPIYWIGHFSPINVKLRKADRFWSRL